MLLEFLRRAMWALFGVPALLIFGYLGGWWLFAPLSVLCLIGMAEYYSAAIAGGFRPAVLMGFLVGTAIIAVTIFYPQNATEITIALLVVLGAAALMSALRPGHKQVAFTSSAITVFGVVYVALMLSFLARLRGLDLPVALDAGGLGEFWHRMGAFVLAVVPVWFCDTFAFLAGKTWGKQPLVPDISPHKTIAGGVAGLLAALTCTLALGLWLGMPWYHAVILGVLLGVFGQVGDMGSSILKRNLDIDDFGTIFGVHGGFLDRFDALLFDMPLLYYYLVLFFVVLK